MRPARPNSGLFGSYDLMTTWGVDGTIIDDTCVVFRLASRVDTYADTLG
jgi:hypothetical protein